MDHAHHFEPISVANSDFPSAAPSAAVTGRPSLANDDTELVTPPDAQDKAATTISATLIQDDWKAGKQEWLIVICLGVVCLMVALDATIVVPALPVSEQKELLLFFRPLTVNLQNIANSIKANGVQSFWIGSSYLLTYAVVQPVLVSLSDIFGRQIVLFFAVICFTVGSIVAALAHGVTQMLVGRVIQGVGGGGIQVLMVRGARSSYV